MLQKFPRPRGEIRSPQKELTVALQNRGAKQGAKSSACFHGDVFDKSYVG